MDSAQFPPQTTAATEVTITTSFVAIATQMLGGLSPEVAVEVENTGGTAFSDFKVQVQDHPQGEFHDRLPARDYLTDVDPTTLAASGISHLQVHVGTAHQIRFMAKVAAGTTTATGKGRASNTGVKLPSLPNLMTPFAAKTAATAWDNGTAISLPINTMFVDVYVAQDTYIVINGLPDGTDPAQNGARYTNIGTHRFFVKGSNQVLHFKRVSADGTLEATAYSIE